MNCRQAFGVNVRPGPFGDLLSRTATSPTVVTSTQLACPSL